MARADQGGWETLTSKAGSICGLVIQRESEIVMQKEHEATESEFIAAELRRQAEEEIVQENVAQSPKDLLMMSHEETWHALHELRVHQIELEIQNEELIKSQAELRAARARYFDLYDLAPVGYVTLSEQGLILEANFTAATLLGVTRGDLVQQPLSRFILKEDLDIFYRLRNQLFDIASTSSLRLLYGQAGQAGALQAYELRLQKKAGTTFWARLEAAVQYPAAGEAQAGTPELRIVLSDITFRKQAEEKLLNQNRTFLQVLNGLNALVYVADMKTYEIVFINTYGQEIWGDIRGKICWQAIQKEQTGPCQVCTNSRLIGPDGNPTEGVVWEFQNTITKQWYDCRDKAIHWPDGRIVRIEIAIDITARKQIEEKLLRSSKLESLGVLAGGIAHDFNNLLGVVQGYMDLVLTDLPPGHVSRQLLLTAMRSVSQTKDLTSRLITFSRGGGPIKEIFDVSEIIREAVQRTVKGTNIRVIFNFRDDLWPAEVDDLQMKQVFNNLTKNAVEATPQGGIMTIQAENALLPAGGVLDLKAGAYLKITFTDEGTGIPEEHLAKIFDPYFSTKRMAAQNGLGLGLAVCYSVLKGHDGHITAQSLPGQGASFVLYIPARPELAKEKEIKKTTSIASRVGPMRVLIMDDDQQVRGLTRAYLERMDYEVTDVQD
ncbi:MAG: ATP-binding protein, partial [Deltaproteobacteria bacterium]